MQKSACVVNGFRSEEQISTEVSFSSLQTVGCRILRVKMGAIIVGTNAIGLKFSIQKHPLESGTVEYMITEEYNGSTMVV